MTLIIGLEASDGIVLASDIQITAGMTRSTGINGTPEWVTCKFATGGGDLFAHALLHKYDLSKLNVNLAFVLAYKVVEGAIQVGAYGLGPPIDLWKIDNDGACQLSEAEVASIADTARTVGNEELKIFYKVTREDNESKEYVSI